MDHLEPPQTSALPAELLTLEDVATLLFPSEYPADQETLEQQGYSEPEIDAINEYISEVHRDRDEWVQSVTIRADELDSAQESHPTSNVLEALETAAYNVQHHNDILDSLIALAVKHTSISSRTVEAAVSMGHNAVRRRAESGDTPEVRSLVSALLRRQAQQYIDVADALENEGE